MDKSIKQQLLDYIREVKVPLAVHEFRFIEASQNNIATRLNELEREGKLLSRYRVGKRFKEWYCLTK